MRLNTIKRYASAVSQYREIGVHTGVESAPPHRLIQMLLDGALEKISIASGHIKRREVAQKGIHISWAISIIEGLRTSLNMESGGELAGNLDRLYEYVSRRLMEANLRNDPALLDEVQRLLAEVRAGWQDIQPFESAKASSEI